MAPMQARTAPTPKIAAPSHSGALEGSLAPVRKAAARITINVPSPTSPLPAVSQRDHQLRSGSWFFDVVKMSDLTFSALNNKAVTTTMRQLSWGTEVQQGVEIPGQGWVKHVCNYTDVVCLRHRIQPLLYINRPYHVGHRPPAGPRHVERGLVRDPRPRHLEEGHGAGRAGSDGGAPVRGPRYALSGALGDLPRGYSPTANLREHPASAKRFVQITRTRTLGEDLRFRR